MMKNSVKEFVAGLILLVIFAGILFWAVFSMPRNSLAILIASAIVLVAVVTYGAQIVSKKRDAESGAPAEDEITRLSRVYSGNRAFIYSICLWLLIFAFNSSYSNNRTMRGLGILSPSLIPVFGCPTPEPLGISMKNRMKELRARENITQARLD